MYARRVYARLRVRPHPTPHTHTRVHRPRTGCSRNTFSINTLHSRVSRNYKSYYVLASRAKSRREGSREFLSRCGKIQATEIALAEISLSVARTKTEARALACVPVVCAINFHRLIAFLFAAIYFLLLAVFPRCLSVTYARSDGENIYLVKMHH